MANQQQVFSFMEATAVAPPQAKGRAAEGRAAGANLHISSEPAPFAATGRAQDLPPAEEKQAPSGRSSAVDTRTCHQESATGPDAAASRGISNESEPPSREAILKSLRAKVGCISTARQSDGRGFSTGCEAMDQWLPTGGLHPSTLTEWIAAHDSAAAGSLAMAAAANRLRQIPGRPLVIVDCSGTFYPPAAVSMGVPHQRMILLRPRSGADAIWAIDQSLRSGAAAAVWASLPMQVDDRDARRLQLAAESGRTPGLLVRGFAARGKPSFAEVQFYVSQQRRELARSVTRRTRDFEVISVTLDRVRGGAVGRQLALQIIDAATIRPLSTTTGPQTKRHETAAEHLASQLAHPAIAKRVAARRDSRTAS
ncbi:ImuA family protein [Planctomycetes bacterium TBK1r]|uniref:SOS cell division inhibitor n=1 Tax=Stieleria magnilauensis TaxID=2527963 RepID=A0ABX5Y0K0_9BACT|nr:SOS cell division inhibitor [Planctomycetes bacterium TBK1r]